MKLYIILLLSLSLGCSSVNSKRSPAEFGFSKIDSGECLLASDSSDIYFWKYERDQQDWRQVQKNDSQILDFVNQPPSDLKVRKVSCTEIWSSHFKNQIDFQKLPSSVISINNCGTGFYISESGYLLTNYHVADSVCKIPEKQQFNTEISCKDKYQLVSFPNRNQYFGKYDFVLMKKKTRNILPISIAPRFPLRGERIFISGYPTQTYKDQYFKKKSLESFLPVVNSGSDSRFIWDPLVFSTGLVDQTLFMKWVICGQ